MSVEKQLDAAQRFLLGIRSLSTYEVIRDKQAVGVQKALEKTTVFSAAQAAAFLGLVQPDLWATSHVEVFREQVALKTSPVASDQPRVIAQDFSLLPYYLSEVLAVAIGQTEADTEQLLFRLCHHAVQLTLRKATLVVLAPKQQHELFCCFKPVVTKYLVASPDAKFHGKIWSRSC